MNLARSGDGNVCSRAIAGCAAPSKLAYTAWRSLGHESHALRNRGSMNASSTVVSANRSARPVPAILVGGLIAGTLDAILAFYTFGSRMPQGIASGLLGRSSFRGGAATWILGLVLH